MTIPLPSLTLLLLRRLYSNAVAFVELLLVQLLDPSSRGDLARGGPRFSSVCLLVFCCRNDSTA